MPSAAETPTPPPFAADTPEAARTMTMSRRIAAPRARVWGAWMNPATLPAWWGPEGYSCRTQRIDLREGGDWVFDMIGPDGTVFPNHHRFLRVEEGRRIDYALLAGENGPKHADVSATFEDVAAQAGGGTKVTLRMVFATQADLETARRFNAEALGLETLGKLAASIGAA